MTSDLGTVSAAASGARRLTSPRWAMPSPEVRTLLRPAGPIVLFWASSILLGWRRISGILQWVKGFNHPLEAVEKVGIGDDVGNMKVLAPNEIEIALLSFIELAITHE